VPIAPVLAATCWLVAKSWLPFTASVLVDETVPFATPVILRSPSVPFMFTAVPPVFAPTVMTLVPGSCCTSPIEPLLIWFCRLVMLFLLVVSALSTAVNAPPTLLKTEPWIV